MWSHRFKRCEEFRLDISSSLAFSDPRPQRLSFSTFLISVTKHQAENNLMGGDSCGLLLC